MYKAFADPAALEVWQAPDTMRAKVHTFDFRIGGGYEMSLFYPESQTGVQGKTAGKEDRFTARFVDLVPDRKILQAVRFQSDDPLFSGDMTIEITFEPTDGGTLVSYVFKDLPAGIKVEDNWNGTRSTLEKLAAYVEKTNR